MAAPPSATTLDFSGAYTINRNLSDSMLAIMKLQSIPWWVQQVARFSTVNTRFEHYADPASNDPENRMHLDEHYTASGVTRTEDRVLDGQPFEREIMFWGTCRISAKRIPVAELEEAFLAEGWDEQSKRDGVVLTHTESLTGKWETFVVWGFAEVDGQRRYVRRIWGKKGAVEERTRVVYDYVAALS